MSYILLRGGWFDIIVLNVQAPTGDKIVAMKDSFYGEVDRVFCTFPKYHMKSLLGYFNGKVGRENFFKPTIGNESLHEIMNCNGIRVVNFAITKNLIVKNKMFLHRNIRKFTWTSDGKTRSQIAHTSILLDRRRHSNVRDGRSFRAADYDTDY
jgi:hypothetical protein